MFGSAGPLGSDPGNNVDGYVLTIADIPPVRATVTNATTGAVLIQNEFESPTNTAASQSGANVVVTWTDNAGGGAPFVYVERSSNGATWTEIGNATGEDETYTDSAPGVGTWYYRLRSGAGENTGRSAYSNTASVTVVAVPAPVLTVTPPSGPAGPGGMSWTATTGPYAWRIATDADFQNVFMSDSTSSTSVSFQDGGGPGAPTGSFWLDVTDANAERSNVVARVWT